MYATDLQTNLAVAKLHGILSATWGLLGGEAAFIPLLALYLFMCASQPACLLPAGQSQGPAAASAVLPARQPQPPPPQLPLNSTPLRRPPPPCSLLRAVAIERFNLFAVFLYVPRPAVLAQAR